MPRGVMKQKTVTLSGTPMQGPKNHSEPSGVPAQNVHSGMSEKSQMRESGAVDGSYTGSFLMGGGRK